MCRQTAFKLGAVCGLATLALVASLLASCGGSARLIGPDPVRDAEPFWNAWADRLDPDAPLRPTYGFDDSVLAAGGRYAVSLHLSGLPYALEHLRTGFSEPTTGELLGVIHDELRHPDAKELRLRAVVLADQDFFRTRPGPVGDLVIDLVKLRRYYRPGADRTAGSWMEALAYEGKAADFVFGALTFELLVLDQPARQGWTSIGIELFDERPGATTSAGRSRGRTLGGISIPACVGVSEDSCPSEKRPERVALGTRNLIRLGHESGTTDDLPDASLFLFELSRTWIVGIFTDTGASHAPLIWTVSRNSEDFYTKLRQIQQSFHETQYRVGVGAALVTLLFPEWASDERRSFQEWVAAHRTASPFATENRKTIFVRAAGPEADEPTFEMPEPFLFPLGLLNFALVAPDAPAVAELEFVGYYFDFEVPLPRESYEPGSRCIGDWRLALPPGDAKDKALLSARDSLVASRRLRTPTSGDERYELTKELTGRVWTDFSEFVAWLNAEAEEPAPLALAIVSHHGPGELRGERAIVHEGNILRRFESSFAVLAACGSGEVGASDILRRLNAKEIDAAIVTNTGIDAKLASHLLDCTATTMVARAEEGETAIAAADLFAGAQKCLYEGKGSSKERWGAAALSFTFAGNPDLSICLEG